MDAAAAVCKRQRKPMQCSRFLKDQERQCKLLLLFMQMLSLPHLRGCFHESTAGAVGFVDAAAPGAIFVTHTTQ